MGNVRGPKAPTDTQKRLRHIVAENVKRLADGFYGPETGERYTERGFAARLTLSPTSLRNIIYESNGCSIDTLQTIADAVGIEVWQLVMPQPPTAPVEAPKRVRAKAKAVA